MGILDRKVDDSDYIDSDAEVDLGTQAVPSSTPKAAPSSSSQGAAKMAPSSSFTATADQLPSPAMPLLQITPGFHFTYFHGPLPSAEELNEGDGLHCAVFDSVPGHPALASDTCLSTNDPLRDPESLLWFCIDDELQYLKFFNDWGPLNIAMFYRFVMHIHWLQTERPECDLVLYTSDDPHHKANAALLMAMYALTKHHATPADAFFPFAHMEFEPYRDAGYGRADFYLTIQDILYGLDKAIKTGLLDLQTFNLEEYEFYEQVANGDFNWITPNFIAFASPNEPDYRLALKAGSSRKPKLRSPLTSGFSKTIEYFKKRNVALVVRLNNPLYEKMDFVDAGIAHEDMYFDDGSNPSDDILTNFIEKAHEVISNNGVVAVHCKAGLGRTGVLIGAYLTWRWGFTANEAIGFMRLMRPGCVVGPQQHFMYQNFPEWIRWGTRDQVLAEARKEVEEKTKALEARFATASSQSHKRPATPSSSMTSSKGRDEDGGPVTPPSKRVARAVPASAAPAVKPVPCVGQPRKSPSPARKRNAQLNAPATTSRLGSLSRSFNQSFSSGEEDSSGTPTGHLLGRSHALRGSEIVNIQSQEVQACCTDTGRLSADTRNNANNAAAKDTAVLSSTMPDARSRPGTHQRARSEVGPGALSSVDEVIAHANLTPTSTRIAAGTFRASPTVKDKYGLRDASVTHDKSPPNASAPTATASDIGADKQTTRMQRRPAETSSPTSTTNSKPRSRPVSRTVSSSSASSTRSDKCKATTVATAGSVPRTTRLVRQTSRNAASGLARADSATLSNKLRTGGTRTAQDVRRELRVAEAAVRAENASSSRLTAPTASSAARSRIAAVTTNGVPWANGRAGLKRPRVDSPEMKSDEFFSSPTSSSQPSDARRTGSSQTATSGPGAGAGRLVGRHVRPRRSSTGEAHVDVRA